VCVYMPIVRVSCSRCARARACGGAAAGDATEAAAAATVAQRGVALVATAHGTCLRDVVRNRALTACMGGVATVTLGDRAAEARGRSNKTVLERKCPPVFGMAVEMRARGDWVVHAALADSVDDVIAAESDAGGAAAAARGGSAGADAEYPDGGDGGRGQGVERRVLTRCGTVLSSWPPEEEDAGGSDGGGLLESDDGGGAAGAAAGAGGGGGGSSPIVIDVDD
jgi:hypothetical protein